jgi:hypothetical protein
MAYRLPNFNLTVNIWRFVPGPYPPAAAPDVISVAQLRNEPRSPILRPVNTYVPLWTLLLPSLTDVRGRLGFGSSGFGGDIVECPAGSGRVYSIEWVDDIAKGFANEHRMALIIQTSGPAPIP